MLYPRGAYPSQALSHFCSLTLANASGTMTPEDVAAHYLLLLKELDGNMLAPENAGQIIKSGDPFSIPANIHQQSDTLKQSLSEFKALIETKFDLEQIKKICLEKLSGTSEKVQDTEAKQAKETKKIAKQLHVIRRSKDPYSESGFNGAKLMTLNGTRYLAYNSYIKSTGPRSVKSTPYVSLMDLSSAKVEAINLLTPRTDSLTIKGKDYVLLYGKDRKIFETNGKDRTEEFEGHLRKVRMGGQVTSAQSLTNGDVIFTVSKSPASQEGSSEVIRYNFDTGTRTTLFSVPKGDVQVAQILKDQGNTYLSFGNVWKTYAALLKIDSKDKSTLKELISHSGRIGASLEGEMYQTASGDVGFVFRGENDSVASFTHSQGLQNISLILNTYSHPSVQRVGEKVLAVVGGDPSVTGSRHSNVVSIVDLETKQTVQSFNAPGRSTKVSSFVSEGKLYLLWGTRDGQMAFLDPTEKAPLLSNALGSNSIKSIAPYFENGTWFAAVTFSGDYAKVYEGPAIVQLLAE